MGTYGLEGVIQAWELEKLTTEQAIGQILQIMLDLDQRLGYLERKHSAMSRKMSSSTVPASLRSIPHTRDAQSPTVPAGLRRDGGRLSGTVASESPGRTSFPTESPDEVPPGLRRRDYAGEHKQSGQSEAERTAAVLPDDAKATEKEV